MSNVIRHGSRRQPVDKWWDNGLWLLGCYALFWLVASWRLHKFNVMWEDDVKSACRQRNQHQGSYVGRNGALQHGRRFGHKNVHDPDVSNKIVVDLSVKGGWRSDTKYNIEQTFKLAGRWQEEIDETKGWIRAGWGSSNYKRGHQLSDEVKWRGEMVDDKGVLVRVPK
jgi:hypothetical protein